MAITAVANTAVANTAVARTSGKPASTRARRTPAQRTLLQKLVVGDAMLVVSEQERRDRRILKALDALVAPPRTARRQPRRQVATRAAA